MVPETCLIEKDWFTERTVEEDARLSDRFAGPWIDTGGECPTPPNARRAPRRRELGRRKMTFESVIVVFRQIHTSFSLELQEVGEALAPWRPYTLV
jgi:hypothetical protein